jgi:hypothetical protein
VAPARPNRPPHAAPPRRLDVVAERRPLVRERLRIGPPAEDPHVSHVEVVAEPHVVDRLRHEQDHRVHVLGVEDAHHRCQPVGDRVAQLADEVLGRHRTAALASIVAQVCDRDGAAHELVRGVAGQLLGIRRIQVGERGT